MHYRLIIYLFVICFTSSLLGQEIKDLIKPVNLIAGRTDSIIISDLFYIKDYRLKFMPNENIDFSYAPSSRTMYLAPKENYEGIDLIGFRYGASDYYIPVKSEKIETFTFKYKPSGSPGKVNLFGSFNSWNREQLPMKDADMDGTYEITIPLPPGRYEYKFFVDGIELIDFDNPVKVPNGMGDYNSVFMVEPVHKEKSYLHILGRKGNEINFYYERENQPDTLRKSHITALLNNYKISDAQIKLDFNFITISLKDEDFNTGKILRAAVTQNGYVSNMQSIFLDDIKPGVKENRSLYDQIIYSIMIDRFFDGDTTNSDPIEHPELKDQANYQGGDLTGILKKIEEGYFETLGVNTLWITPVNDNTGKAYKEYPPPHRYYTGYHGYWPIHHTRVEEHFGNMQILKDLVSAAHKRGIKVILDYVAHHIHIEHPFWSEHPEWFGKLDLPDGRKNLRLWDEHRLTTWFEPYMPSFDFTKSKEALEFMTDNAVWWLNETGIDGFRHDAVKHVPNSFWRRLTEKIKSKIEFPLNKKIFQIGETFGGYDLISSYVNNGQLNAQFNFNLYDNAIPVFLGENTSFKVLDAEMKKTFSVYGVNHLMGNIMDSHDKVRFMSFADGDIPIGLNDAGDYAWNNPPKVDKKTSYDKLKLYLAYLNTIPGIPIIYYGDEIGMTGASDPDNRRMMRFDEEINELEKETFNSVSKIINLRSTHTALRYGDFQTLYSDSSLYVFLRSDLNERILVALNKSGNIMPATIQIPDLYEASAAEDLTTGEKLEIKGSELKFENTSFGYRIFRIE